MYFGRRVLLSVFISLCRKSGGHKDVSGIRATSKSGLCWKQTHQPSHKGLSEGASRHGYDGLPHRHLGSGLFVSSLGALTSNLLAIPRTHCLHLGCKCF